MCIVFNGVPKAFLNSGVPAGQFAKVWHFKNGRGMRPSIIIPLDDSECYENPCKADVDESADNKSV